MHFVDDRVHQSDMHQAMPPVEPGIESRKREDVLSDDDIPRGVRMVVLDKMVPVEEIRHAAQQESRQRQIDCDEQELVPDGLPTKSIGLDLAAAEYELQQGG